MICPKGCGGIPKSFQTDGTPQGGEWGYYYPRCWDCGAEGVSLSKLIEIAKEVDRYEEAKWHKAE